MKQKLLTDLTYLVQGLVWFLLIMGFLSANSSFCVVQYIEILVSKETYYALSEEKRAQNPKELEYIESVKDGLIPVIIQVGIGFLLQVVYFIFFRHQILQFVQNVALVEEKEDLDQFAQSDTERYQQYQTNNNNVVLSDPNSDPQLLNNQQPPQKVRMAYKSKFVLEEKNILATIDLPQFVSKVSSTYFKFLMNKKDVQKEIDLKDSQKNNQKSKSQKQTSSTTTKTSQNENNRISQSKKPSQSRHASKASSKSIASRLSNHLNRSATATITMTTQGAMNTQGDLISSRIGQLEKFFSDPNEDGEPGFKPEPNIDKKDLRAENFNKKNQKALQKQLNQEALNLNGINNNSNSSPGDTQIHKKVLTEHSDHDEIIITTQGDEKSQSNFRSQQANSNQALNGFMEFKVPPNRRQISFAGASNTGNHQTRQHSIGLNQTAPFAVKSPTANEDLINEVEEPDSYYIQRQINNQQYNDQDDEDNQEEFDGSQLSSALRAGSATINGAAGVDQSQNQSTIRSQQQSIVSCLVCFDQQPDSIFNPCGHGGLCHECAIDLMKKTGECLLCRLKIEEILKIDVESREKGIMKILTSTKFIKVREKIQITEQEYQYYSELKRNRQIAAAAAAQNLPYQQEIANPPLRQTNPIPDSNSIPQNNAVNDNPNGNNNDNNHVNQQSINQNAEEQQQSSNIQQIVRIPIVESEMNDPSNPQNEIEENRLSSPIHSGLLRDN